MLGAVVYEVQRGRHSPAAWHGAAAESEPVGWLLLVRLPRRHRPLSRNRGQRSSKRKAADKVLVSVSDSEAVVGRDKEKGYRPWYNVPVVDDLDSPFVLGYEVFAQQNDAGLLATMLARLNEGLGHPLRTPRADTAYAGGADLAAAGHSISRGEHEERMEALRARMATAEAKALYRLRSQTVALVNADGKEHRQQRRFSGRGLTRVRCPVGLVVLTHNLVTLRSEHKKARVGIVNPVEVAT